MRITLCSRRVPEARRRSPPIENAPAVTAGAPWPERGSDLDHLELAFQGLAHFAILREAALGLFREHQLIVQLDLENATTALDQLRFDTEFLLNFRRQTGGAGLVVSNNTIFDGHRMRHETSSEIGECLGSLTTSRAVAP